MVPRVGLIGAVLQGRHDGRDPALDHTLEPPGQQGFQVEHRLAPPRGHGARDLEAVQQPHPRQRSLETLQQCGSQCGQIFTARQDLEESSMLGPPALEGALERALPGLHARVLFDDPFEVAVAVEARVKIPVGEISFDEEVLGVEAVRGEQVGLGRDLGLGHAAQQVRPHVLRLGGRGVVGVAADVQVVVVLGQLGVAHAARKAVEVLETLEGVDDFFEVLGLQIVLRAARAELGVGVDEEDLSPPLGGLRAPGSQDQNAGRNSSSIKEIGRQPDDRLQQVVLDKTLADLPLGPAAKQHAVRHNRADHAPLAQHGDHVLHEHEVGLLAGLGTPAVGEALGEGHAFGAVVLRERRVREHPVKTHQLAALGVQGLGEGVAVAQVGVGDAVQDEVHLGDGPDPAVVFLPVEAQVARVAAVLGHVLLRQDEHTARAGARVVDPHPLGGLGQAHHHAHHASRRIELAPLFARRVGKLSDEVLVGGAEQVGELKVLVAQADLVEVLDQLAQFLVRQSALAHRAGEIDVVQDPFERRVVLFEGAQGLIQTISDVGVDLVAQVGPAGAFGDEEGLVEGWSVRALFGVVLGAAAGELLLDDDLAARLELVGAAFEEEHAEDVLLELGGIHFAAQDVGGAEEVAFELGEGEGGHGGGAPGFFTGRRALGKRIRRG